MWTVTAYSCIQPGLKLFRHHVTCVFNQIMSASDWLPKNYLQLKALYIFVATIYEGHIHSFYLKRKVTPLRDPLSAFWFKRAVKEAIDGHLEKSSLNRGDGVRHHLSATFGAVFGGLPRWFNPHKHLESCDPKVSHDTRGEGQTLLSDSHLGSCDLNDSHDAKPDSKASLAWS